MAEEMVSSSDSPAGVPFMTTVSGLALSALTPPANLLVKEICHICSVLVSFRNSIDTRRAKIGQHSSASVIVTLDHDLYDEPEDRAAAVELALQILASSRHVRSELHNSELQARELRQIWNRGIATARI